MPDFAPPADPPVAVEAATQALVDSGAPEPPPRDPQEMLDYWAGPQGSRDLGAELGRPFARKPRGPDPGALTDDPGWRAYHAWRNQARDIQRWRSYYNQGRGQRRQLTGRELTAVRRATGRRWRREHPRPRRSQVLTGLLRAGAIVEFSGLVQISNDQGHRRHTSIVSGSNAALAAYVAAALDRRWGEATEALTVAWNSGYGIPGRPAWINVDRLEIE